jgi:hypothetical protein
MTKGWNPVAKQGKGTGLSKQRKKAKGQAFYKIFLDIRFAVQ